MSEVSEILQSIQDQIGIELFPKSAMANPDSPNVLLLKRCQALLQSHAVIDIDAAKASENGCFSTGAYEESRTIQSELDRLTPTKVVT